MKLLILAGGTGSRLWPVSRTYNPTQFVKVKGMELSPFQKTILNVSKVFNPLDIIIVTNKEYKYFVYGQLKEINIDIPNENIILEPNFKNTLHAVSLGIYSVKERTDILIISSNNIFDDYTEILNAVKECGADNSLTLFGVKADNTLSKYGYLQIKEDSCKFIEKPGRELGYDLLKKGYLCNSGMCWTEISAYKKALNNFYPELADLLEKKEIDAAYKLDINDTLEHGLLEKINNLNAAAINININEMNEFQSFYDHYKEHKDINGNIYFDNNAVFINSQDNLVYTENSKAIGCIGVDNIIVIDQPDALLICNKDETERVSAIVQRLKEKNDERADIHVTAYRPWGSYTVLEEGICYKIKRLTVLPAKKLSYQMHYHRSEHWVVVNGAATIVKGDIDYIVKPGESIYISAGEKHRLENRGKTILEVIEVQIGSYLGEDDIIRFEDEYGR